MGETLDETRLEVTAKRAELERRAAELEARVRHALDIRARFRENPALFIGLGTGAVFLVAGGPVRVARMLRRRLRPSPTEQAYDALPKTLQSWVDSMAGGVGPKAGEARAALAEELQRWRHEPLKNRKSRRELAKAMADGPPGPSRAGWKAAEAGLTLLSAALARRAIEAFVTGERPIRPGKRPAAAQAAHITGAPGVQAPNEAAPDATREPGRRQPGDPPAAYSGFSRRRS